MARFSCEASDQAPLIVQLTSTSSGAGSYVSVFAAKSAGNGTSGSSSRPVFYRPSSPGIGTGQTAEVRGWIAGTTPASTTLTSFTSAPSTPTLTTGALNLPIRVSWMTDPSTGLIVSRGGSIVFYQNATGGQLLSGGISFEEA